MKFAKAVLVLFLMFGSPVRCDDTLFKRFIVIKRGELVTPEKDGTILIESNPITLASRDVAVFASISQMRRQDVEKRPPPELILKAYHILEDFHTRTFQTKVVSDGTQSMSAVANVAVVSPTMKFVVHAGGLDPTQEYQVILTVHDR